MKLLRRIQTIFFKVLMRRTLFFKLKVSSITGLKDLVEQSKVLQKEDFIKLMRTDFHFKRLVKSYKDLRSLCTIYPELEPFWLDKLLANNHHCFLLTEEIDDVEVLFTYFSDNTLFINEVLNKDTVIKKLAPTIFCLVDLMRAIKEWNIQLGCGLSSDFFENLAAKFTDLDPAALEKFLCPSSWQGFDLLRWLAECCPKTAQKFVIKILKEESFFKSAFTFQEYRQYLNNFECLVNVFPEQVPVFLNKISKNKSIFQSVITDQRQFSMVKKYFPLSDIFKSSTYDEALEKIEIYNLSSTSLKETSDWFLTLHLQHQDFTKKWQLQGLKIFEISELWSKNFSDIIIIISKLFKEMQKNYDSEGEPNILNKTRRKINLLVLDYYRLEEKCSRDYRNILSLCLMGKPLPASVNNLFTHCLGAYFLTPLLEPRKKKNIYFFEAVGDLRNETVGTIEKNLNRLSQEDKDFFALIQRELLSKEITQQSSNLCATNCLEEQQAHEPKELSNH